MYTLVRRFIKTGIAFLFLGTPQGGAAGAGILEDGTAVVDSTDSLPGRGLVALSGKVSASVTIGSRRRHSLVGSSRLDSLSAVRMTSPKPAWNAAEMRSA